MPDNTNTIEEVFTWLVVSLYQRVACKNIRTIGRDRTYYAIEFTPYVGVPVTKIYPTSTTRDLMFDRIRDAISSKSGDGSPFR